MTTANFSECQGCPKNDLSETKIQAPPVCGDCPHYGYPEESKAA